MLPHRRRGVVLTRHEELAGWLLRRTSAGQASLHLRREEQKKALENIVPQGVPSSCQDPYELVMRACHSSVVASS